MTQERSQVSINYLQRKVESFFSHKKETIGNCELWFADYPNLLSNDQPVTDVILFGSFFRRILESGNWPFSRIRLWCLSPSVKEVLIGLYGFRDEEIGLIPRNELFPQSLEIRSFPDLRKPWTLVFSGRLSPTKNVETFLVVGHFLQKFFSPDLQLVCQGEFQDDLDPLIDRSRGESYQAYIKGIVSSLTWTHPPQFIPSSFDHDWTEDHSVNPVFASFTLFSAEDFGVSVAQARAQGWPVILSEWGGQRDVSGSSVIKISPHSIPEAWESLHSLLVKGEYLARVIASRWGEGVELFEQKIFVPVVLDPMKLYDRRQFFVKKLGANFSDLYCGEGKIENFFKTDTGKKMYAHYRQLFSGPLSQKKHLIIATHDMEPQAGEAVELVPEIIRVWLNYALALKIEVDFLFVRDLMKRLRFYRHCDLEALVFPFFVNSLLPLIKFLTQDFALHCPLLAFYNVKQDGIHSDLIIQNFRFQDAYILVDHEKLMHLPEGQNPLFYLENLKKIKTDDLFSVVELEINSDCNRRCSYCPNSLTPRKSPPQMSLELFKSVLVQLSELAFSGILSFHFYNEPLLHPDLVSWVKQATSFLPDARICLYSNGSLLSRELFEDLLSAGIEKLIVTRHEGISYLPLDDWYLNLPAESCKRLILQKHEEVQKTNRAGMLCLGPMIPPKLPCYMPSSMIVVTSEGNVIPCYEDFNEKLCLGNISQMTLREIWQSSKAKNLRDNLAKGQRMNFEPCSTCNNSKIFPIR